MYNTIDMLNPKFLEAKSFKLRKDFTVETNCGIKNPTL